MQRRSLGWYKMRAISGSVFGILGIVIAVQIALRPAPLLPRLPGQSRRCRVYCQTFGLKVATPEPLIPLVFSAIGSGNESLRRVISTHST